MVFISSCRSLIKLSIGSKSIEVWITFPITVTNCYPRKTSDVLIWKKKCPFDTNTGTTTQHLVGRSLAVVVASSIIGTGLGAFQRTVIYRDSASERLSGSLVFRGPITIQDLTFGGIFWTISSVASPWNLALLFNVLLSGAPISGLPPPLNS